MSMFNIFNLTIATFKMKRKICKDSLAMSFLGLERKFWFLSNAKLKSKCKK